MAGATRQIVVDAPIEKVFATVTDYENYGKFSPELRSIRVGKRTGNEVELHYEIDVVKTIHYSLRMKEEKPNRLSWTFIDGEFMKDNTGSWVLEPMDGGKTRVTYNVEVKLGMLVPKTIVNMLVDQNLPKMLDAFKRVVESA